ASPWVSAAFPLKTQNSLRSNSCVFLTAKTGKYSAVQSAAVSYKVSLFGISWFRRAKHFGGAKILTVASI
ncbi:MAG: hypothetical protein R3302_09020, partial [Sulfurimonadaceae bacterium]|nr:hypothetical protein [Sulfurimonadaceae bacterium]